MHEAVYYYYYYYYYYYAPIMWNSITSAMLKPGNVQRNFVDLCQNRFLPMTM
jgi:hypothetical protein